MFYLARLQMKKLFFLVIIFFSIYPLFVTAVIDEQEIVKLLEEQEKQSNVNVNFDEIKTEDVDIQAQKMHEVADIQPVHQQEDLSNVVSWMAKNWLTSFWSLDKFRPNDFVTREQMAKFAVSFALLVNKQWNTNPNCWFKDIYRWDKNLIPYLISACSMSILKWANWYIQPTKWLTKWEAVTIIMRLIRNDINTNSNPRYKNAYNLARAYWITYDTLQNMTKKTTRWEIAIMFYRAYKFLKQ